MIVSPLKSKYDVDMRSIFRKTRKGFTLLEVIIVTTLIAVLSIVAIFFINPKKQLEKAWDSQRKSHLAHLARVLEDYYNDHTTYPSGTSLCYDTVTQDSGTCTCHICGAAGNESAMSVYIKRLYCDPEFSKKNYLYEYDCASSVSRWFRMCAALSIDGDMLPNAQQYHYNYGISSNNVDVSQCASIPYTTVIPTPTNSPTLPPAAVPNTPSPSPTVPGASSPTPTAGSTFNPSNTPAPPLTLIFCPADPNAKYCLKNGVCNNCGNYTNCLNSSACNQPVQLYANPQCTTMCQ